MYSFISNVLHDLNSKDLKLSNLVFILPSRRAGVFLKRELSLLIQTPIFSPTILSIEEFVEDLSELKHLPDTELLFRLYACYRKLTPPEERESFDSFFTWANVLLQDFNEIDRYLINQNQIFDYLNAIKEIDHWSLEKNQTDLIKKHLLFWNRLKSLYNEFVDDLKDTGHGYQGLIYREASNNIEMYMANFPDITHVFLGFNALNSAEKAIIQELLDNELAKIYWDIDKTFLNDNYHDAGLFIRDYKSNWRYFKEKSFNWVCDEYAKPKSIKFIGTPKNVGQAKHIGQIIDTIIKDKGTIEKTAVVLGEESLLLPLLNSLPKSLDAVNITMGLPLSIVPLANLFSALFHLHKNTTKSFYFRDVIDILMLPAVKLLFHGNGSNDASVLINYLQQNNVIYLKLDLIKSIVSDRDGLLDLIFDDWQDSPDIAIENTTALIFKIKELLDPALNSLELEYLYRFNNLLNKLKDLNTNFKYIDNISSLHRLFQELLNMETLDFQGEPLEGLQIMGMLESRVLDFETVIISSVNEGILPAGKTTNSFIPYDVKRENNLPTFKEKDAVYTYHFYRLIQRAKQVYIIYNTEVDSLKGGEKSRFLTQMEIEGIHSINHVLAQPQIPVIKTLRTSVKKSSSLVKKIKDLAQDGFSPSSLSSYIRNPLGFYFEKILKIKEYEDVEENVEANTLGTIIHDTLEAFYKPYENTYLTEDILSSLKNRISNEVEQRFKNTYKEGNFKTGKNLIIFEIAKHFISNFIDMELHSLKNGNTIKIIAIETNEKTSIEIDGIEVPITIGGKVDRIDEFNGNCRIIDYKSGKVEKNKLLVENWGRITEDYDRYSKPFQLLCYTYILYKEKKISLPVEAGIYSFKNLSAGLMKFTEKNSTTYNKKSEAITEATLSNFENELKKLILEIFNPNIDFIEKET